MNREEKQALHGMNIDDAYVVERQLAHGVDGVTELVSLDGAGPFVRKRIPLASVRRMVWAALAECDSPYLPRVHAMYELPDEFVAVCDYVPGETLEQVMERRGHLPLAEVAPIVANVCGAVAELHAHGVVHADIAPRNVVLAEDGAHLIDFGIARMVFDKPKRDEKAWGTRGFAAPEQHGFAAVDIRSDIYAIGRLAGYLLTGAVLAEKTFEGELRCSGMVPESACRVLGRACAFEPSSRYQNVEDFATAFATACAGGAVPEAPGAFSLRARSSPHRTSGKCPSNAPSGFPRIVRSLCSRLLRSLSCAYVPPSIYLSKTIPLQASLNKETRRKRLRIALPGTPIWAPRMWTARMTRRPIWPIGRQVAWLLPSRRGICRTVTCISRSP